MLSKFAEQIQFQLIIYLAYNAKLCNYVGVHSSTHQLTNTSNLVWRLWIHLCCLWVPQPREQTSDELYRMYIDISPPPWGGGGGKCLTNQHSGLCVLSLGPCSGPVGSLITSNFCLTDVKLLPLSLPSHTWKIKKTSYPWKLHTDGTWWSVVVIV